MTARDAFHTVFYHGVVSFLKFVLHFGSRVRFVRFGKIPKGACVMVSNHISHFDPPFLSGWLPRKIDWIAMVELFGASWSKAAVVPVVILGSERLYNGRNWLPWRRAKVYIAVGERVFPSPDGGRKKLRDDVAAALVRLKDDLVTKCHLTADDLPHSPQQRMREP